MTRIAIIKKEKCFPKKCGGICAEVCPINRTEKECIIIDDKASISEELCIGCGVCVKKCPFGAINIINLPAELKEKPVFRYGKNSFELFRLPAPSAGKVVGVIGANGIGKSTALDILANLKRPNFGEFDIQDKKVKPREFSNQDIITKFRGTNLQNFFTNAYENKIKISYKPQYVDRIPEQFKGKVNELMGNMASQERVNEIAKKINIAEIINRDVNELSGGELQKVAIATALLKDADLYLIDEPASYLDIKERINVARVIREFAEKGKAIIVVEHDLIILDYLTDVVHILFGKTACYGVVSHPMSSKNGVNAYLDGFLKDENIRFRDESIKFDTTLKEKPDITSIVSWPDLKKKLGNFNLSVESSEIHNKEIVGIIGANAIGKTTFMKLLAGLIEPDSGKIEKKLRISYKPQYIKAKSSATVLATLLEVNNCTLSQENKLYILQPLQIEHLLEKQINELSGGELQRVAIAECLLREADLYLLDEPSTYLDVEQRLSAAKTIEKVIKEKESTAIVIDHDLLFTSYLADRILVFEGEPGVEGFARSIKSVNDGMNVFLKGLNITLRKDPDTGRPRVNLPGSQKDKEQKEIGLFYATEARFSEI